MRSSSRRTAEVGDISISPFPGGYLVGRILDFGDRERMWEHIASTPHVADAYRIACQHANGGAVWFCEGPNPVEVDCVSMGLTVDEARDRAADGDLPR